MDFKDQSLFDQAPQTISQIVTQTTPLEEETRKKETETTVTGQQFVTGQETVTEQQAFHPEVFKYNTIFTEMNVRPLKVTAPAGIQAPAQPTSLLKRIKEHYQAKKAMKQYKSTAKNAKQNQQLLDITKIRDMDIFKTASGQKRWLKEKLPHSKYTREQTLSMIEHNNFSNFENLDPIMRSLAANKAMNTLEESFKQYLPTETSEGDLNAIVNALFSNKKDLSLIQNPALRLGLSQYQRIQNPDAVQQKKITFYRQLDELLSKQVIDRTMTTVPVLEDLVDDYMKTEKLSQKEATAKAKLDIEINSHQQIDLAKKFMLMQLSDFRRVENDGKDYEWDTYYSTAFTHLSRVLFLFPMRTESGANSSENMDELWDTIKDTQERKNLVQLLSRASSTHDLEQMEVRDSSIPELNPSALSSVKEIKVGFNFKNQYGANIAAGGLGNKGVSGNMIKNHGRHTHMFFLPKVGDLLKKKRDAFAVSMESEAPHMKNEYGHKHSWTAGGEANSVPGGQRTDEIGRKLGGRVCDLSKCEANKLTEMLNKVETAMLKWQSTEEGMEGPEATELISLLTGKKLNEEGWARVNELLDGILNNKDVPEPYSLDYMDNRSQEIRVPLHP